MQMVKQGIPDYKVIIRSEREGSNKDGSKEVIEIVADVPEEFMFDVAAQYEAPFSSGLAPAGWERSNTALRMLGMSLTNQTMTAQVWQGNTDVQFSLPLVFQAETDASKEVLEPIINLMKLTMPIEKERGGLLESPGPRWDLGKLDASWNAIKSEATSQGTEDVREAGVKGFKDISNSLLALDGVGIMQSAIGLSKTTRKGADQFAKTFSKGMGAALVNKISLKIGRFLYFDSVVIESISQTSTAQPERNTGIFMRSQVQVSFKTFMLPTQNDLESMYPYYQVSQNPMDYQPM